MSDGWKQYAAMKTEEVNERILSKLPKEEGLQELLLQAMNYSVENGGKRIRPMLIQETYAYFGGDEYYLDDLVVPFMAAMEMIHSYSLVHDDLPAMDNDDYRRGKLTTHKKYGYAMGILAGDGLLNYAYETALTAHAEDPVMAARILPALQVLAHKAGVFGMVGGQSVDVMRTGEAMTEEEMDFVYRLKTGALLEASMMIGAILAGAPEEAVKAVEQVASMVGMAFQIQDDILDMTSTTEELGKPVHSDEKNAKTTYVTVYGIENASTEVERLSVEAVDLLRRYHRTRERAFLPEFLLSLVKRKN